MVRRVCSTSRVAASGCGPSKGHLVSAHAVPVAQPTPPATAASACSGRSPLQRPLLFASRFRKWNCSRGRDSGSKLSSVRCAARRAGPSSGWRLACRPAGSRAIYFPCALRALWARSVRCALRSGHACGLPRAFIRAGNAGGTYLPGGCLAESHTRYPARPGSRGFGPPGISCSASAGMGDGPNAVADPRREPES